MLQTSLLEIANSSVYALDELWTVSDSSGDKVSLLDTISDPRADDPQESLASNEIKDRLTEAIASLPEREQLVVALYYYEGLTLREIGEVLGRHRVAGLPAAHQGGDAVEVGITAGVGSTCVPHKAADRIRNVALIGHRGSGKTSLHEAMLFEAGVANRLGRSPTARPSPTMSPTSRGGEMSIDASVATFEHEGRKINLIDTPGEPSFVADAVAALRVADAAVVVVNAAMGVEVHTERLWRRADAEGLARLVFVNMLDRERADFFAALDSLKALLRRPRRRDRDPDRHRTRGPRSDRPDRHEGVRQRGHGPRQRHRGRDPRRAPRPRPRSTARN